MIEIPGIRRTTSEASLSCVLAICWLDTPLITNEDAFMVVIIDISVLALRLRLTTTASIALDSGSNRILTSEGLPATTRIFSVSTLL